jgi:hypothetical protein
MSEKSPKRSPTHFLSNQVWKSMEKVAQDVNKYLLLWVQKELLRINNGPIGSPRLKSCGKYQIRAYLHKYVEGNIFAFKAH